MEVSYLIGFAIFWMCLFWARSISNKAIRALDDGKKALLVDLATENRSMQIAILVVGIVAFYAVSYLVDSHRELWFGLYGLFIIAWMIFRIMKTTQSYREKEFPAEFIKAQFNASFIRVAGITLFFGFIGMNFMFRK